MKMPPFKKLTQPALTNVIATLPHDGQLAIFDDSLIYLKTDDGYIHQLFPLLQQLSPAIEKPDYFIPELDFMGAHISVVYPEENTTIHKKHLGEQHSFEVVDLYMATLHSTTYYVLSVEAPSLLQLRREYGLSETLLFQGFWVKFHITIGVEKLNI